MLDRWAQKVSILRNPLSEANMQSGLRGTCNSNNTIDTSIDTSTILTLCAYRNVVSVTTNSQGLLAVCERVCIGTESTSEDTKMKTA